MNGVTIREWNPSAVVRMVERNNRSNMEALGKELIEKIREQMVNTPRDPGKRFWSKELGAMHTPSAEGEYPAIMTKQLYDSLEYRVVGDTLQIGVGLDTPGEEGYAVYLEYGWTSAGGQFHARPYLRTSVFFNEDLIKKHLGIV